jgi:hypothetical protein
MATDNTNNGGSNSVLAFIVGILLAAVVVFGFFMYTGGHLLPQNNGPTFNLNVKTPAAPKPSGG